MSGNLFDVIVVNNDKVIGKHIAEILKEEGYFVVAGCRAIISWRP